jgi:hypothetical protein
LNTLSSLVVVLVVVQVVPVAVVPAVIAHQKVLL